MQLTQVSSPGTRGSSQTEEEVSMAVVVVLMVVEGVNAEVEDGAKVVDRLGRRLPITQTGRDIAAESRQEG